MLSKSQIEEKRKALKMLEDEHLGVVSSKMEQAKKLRDELFIDEFQKLKSASEEASIMEMDVNKVELGAARIEVYINLRDALNPKEVKSTVIVLDANTTPSSHPDLWELFKKGGLKEKIRSAIAYNGHEPHNWFVEANGPEISSLSNEGKL